jgi:GTPase SAR1 family protein
MQEITIFIAGMSGVGKTAYMNRLMESSYNVIHRNSESQTGVFVLENNHRVRIRLTTNGRLPADGVILMFDRTRLDTYTSLSQQHSVVSDLHPNVPVILFGNKSDLPSLQVRNEDIAYHREAGLQYYSGAAKSNYNFDKPIRFIVCRCTGLNLA